MFVLHVRLPDNSEREVALPSGELLLLGRGNAATLRLDDPSMSRVHCRLLARGGRVILTDAGSRWGTLVNDELVTETEVRPGDEITIGETIITLKTRGRAEATTIAPPIERVAKQRRAAGSEPDEHFDTATESAFDSAIVAEAVFDSGSISGSISGSPGLDESEDPSGNHFVEQFSVKAFNGSRFARYDIKEVLAEARTGLVFRAHDSESDVDVALKLFRPEVLESQSDRQ
ncbi:MAG: serine/threonine-protein kinase, partial [Planctomycetota bacterium]|nr:serine/threonine-protein kinase [Planctomycetota bacterium]